LAKWAKTDQGQHRRIICGEKWFSVGLGWASGWQNISMHWGNRTKLDRYARLGKLPSAAKAHASHATVGWKCQSFRIIMHTPFVIRYLVHDRQVHRDYSLENLKHMIDVCMNHSPLYSIYKTSGIINNIQDLKHGMRSKLPGNTLFLVIIMKQVFSVAWPESRHLPALRFTWPHAAFAQAGSLISPEIVNFNDRSKKGLFPSHGSQICSHCIFTACTS
jgi:hypothetical protein